MVPGQSERRLGGPVPATVAKLDNGGEANSGLNVSLQNGGYFKLPDTPLELVGDSVGLDMKVLEFGAGLNTHVFADNTSLAGGSVSFELGLAPVESDVPFQFLVPLGYEAIMQLDIFGVNLNGSNASSSANMSNVSTAPVERCMYWDVAGNKWSSKGCAVLGIDPARGIVCECYHLTEFASTNAATLPATNSVNPLGGASALLSATGAQIWIIASMIAILVLYLLCSAWGRSADASAYHEFRKHPAKYIRKRDHSTKGGKHTMVSDLRSMLQKKHVSACPPKKQSMFYVALLLSWMAAHCPC